MGELFEKHIELIEAVNNSETVDEHTYRHSMLIGFRAALSAQGINQLIECDWHIMEKENKDESKRPICCGVYLDWEPKE